jgi:hypothetical protein
MASSVALAKEGEAFCKTPRATPDVRSMFCVYCLVSV